MSEADKVEKAIARAEQANRAVDIILAFALGLLVGFMAGEERIVMWVTG